MQFQNKITPFLSFASQAEQAAEHYTSILPDSHILRKVYQPGTQNVMTVEFELAGLTFVSLNTGQDWPFTNAFSLAVSCQSQAEIDHLWDALLEGGQPLFCGWLTDKFGVSWQIVPANIGHMLSDSDPERVARVFAAVQSMVKLDMGQLQAAYDGE